MAKRRPGRRSIGARIRIKHAHAEEVASLFHSYGVEPSFVETLDEREVAFYFTKAQVRQEQTVSAIEAIPREFWAVVAVVTDGLPPTVH